MLKKILLLLGIWLCFLSFYTGVFASGTSVDMTSTDFMVDTSNFTVSKSDMIQATATDTMNTVLGTLIKKFLIGLGILSLAVMSIGAGYMIIPSSSDELNNKGKFMFKMALISLVVALSSYYIVNLVAYFLYEGDSGNSSNTVEIGVNE